MFAIWVFYIHLKHQHELLKNFLCEKSNEVELIKKKIKSLHSFSHLRTKLSWSVINRFEVMINSSEN